ncbi:MAG: hypothetical protein ABIP17_01260, partial [Ilumatobacteraceae bacterium]
SIATITRRSSVARLQWRQTTLAMWPNESELTTRSVDFPSNSAVLVLHHYLQLTHPEIPESLII